ncbi:clamp loader of DNA polymerase [Vibrio phage VAP7]|uniref:Clamp loader A subunit n=2 Tax=Vapseptimavirus VAP7 TaxID=2841303 RepID=A0A4Y5TXL5_9CAUD|nr:clamp loader of DNA polymerase [Vibrio phage VAP7]AWY10161.1 clamp holder subunit DNA polymerase accessory protein [Vibrio phage VP-1]QDB73347.1 clamp loader A subunit [Vibrio phage VAP7]UFD98161.1 hypothetical protein [Vibrio phage BX-1]
MDGVQNLEEVKIGMFDWGNSINKNKNNLLSGNPFAIKQYDPWSIRRLVAQSQDTLIEACEMNKVAHIAPEFQYMYFLHAIPPKARYSKWPKKQVVPEEIEQLAHYWGENIENTMKIFNRMNDAELEQVLSKINKGGRGKITKKGRK